MQLTHQKVLDAVIRSLTPTQLEHLAEFLDETGDVYTPFMERVEAVRPDMVCIITRR